MWKKCNKEFGHIQGTTISKYKCLYFEVAIIAHNISEIAYSEIKVTVRDIMEILAHNMLNDMRKILKILRRKFKRRVQ